MMHLAPGGPLAVYTLNPTITAQDIERIKHVFGLDQPGHIQYLKWAAGMFTGNWGNTFFGGRPVFDVI
jgi:peptide/nickel transport system permease protein